MPEKDFTIKEIEALRKLIDKDIDDLYNARTVLESVKVLLNYKNTGKPYPDDEFGKVI